MKNVSNNQTEEDLKRENHRVALAKTRILVQAVAIAELAYEEARHNRNNDSMGIAIAGKEANNE